MVLGWLAGSKQQNLAELIAKKQYRKAVDLLQAEFEKGDRSPRFRLQFADVLVLAGRGRDALPILLGLADEFARDGFAAKAIAILKKAEKLQPGDPAVGRRLAGLIEERQRSVTITASGSFVMAPFDVEEVAAPAEPPAPQAAPAPDEDLAQGLMDLIQRGVDEVESPAQPSAPTAIPLFGDFSPEELAAVIQGLRLATFQPGDIIVTLGERGESLFVLTSGSVKAFVRNPEGRHVQVRELKEGDFFGEISVLSGSPRTATVTAASRCELLELDRATLDDIVGRHPRVRQVLEQFAKQRRDSPEAARAKRGA